MPTNYDPLGTESSIQVLSPTLVQEVVVSTIKTKPHGVIFEYWLAKEDFDAGTGPVILDQVAGGVEHIMASQPVIAGVGNTELDASGLLQEYVTFTVAYQVPGSNTGPLTVDVDVPVTDFGQDTIAGENFGLADAEQKIQAAYKNLEALATG